MDWLPRVSIGLGNTTPKILNKSYSYIRGVSNVTKAL